MTTTARRRSKKEPDAPGKTVRVAIYTRKSVEEGLEQEFNSLDAQRLAIGSFIEAQRSERWVAIPETYEDGGFSGANIARPAFQRLLQDVDAGKVDVVAVHRIDRLSRSLLDFLQVMQLFERRVVSFVSVTQPLFNTATSSGRLMLNILMSFAAYERELIAERTSAKMVAARRRGMWTGGNPILGYDALERKLVVNGDEAERARDIFKLHLELGSTLAVAEELNHRGWRMKSRRTKGAEIPGGPFTKNSVGRILTNPTYIGKVSHAGELHQGIHEAIVDQETWDAVQDLLQAQCREKGPRVRSKWGMLLQGIVRCAVCGAGMTTHYSARKGKRYFYYVCQSAQKRGAAACKGSRVVVAAVEGAVVERIRAIGRAPDLIEESLRAIEREVEQLRPELRQRLEKLEGEHAYLDEVARNLVSALGKGSGDALIHQRLGELHVAIAEAEAGAREARAELEALEGRVIDPEDLRRAIESFDPVWGELFPAERARILRLLIERVTYDGRTREVTVQFRPGGVRALAGEGEEKAKLA